MNVFFLSKHFYQLSKEPSLWKWLCVVHFPSIDVEYICDWKTEFTTTWQHDRLNRWDPSFNESFTYIKKNKSAIGELAPSAKSIRALYGTYPYLRLIV